MMKNIKFRRGDLIIQIVLVLIAAIWLVPVVTALRTSLSGNGWGNYQLVFSTTVNNVLILPRMFRNSMFVTTVTILIILTFAILGAYAFSKMQFRGRKLLYLAFVGCFSIPMIATLIPNSILFARVGLRGSYTSMILILATINLPLAMMIFKSYFDALSNTFLEAAKMDGSNSFRTLLHVVVPMSTPVIVNVLVVMFIQVWNDFQVPLIFATRTDMYTLPMAPRFFGLSANRLDLPPLYASIIILVVPVVIFYMIWQDKIIEGMTMGGIKE